MIKILKEESLNDIQDIWKSKWINLKRCFIENEKGIKGLWEYSERISKEPPVVIVAKSDNNELSIIKQFRVPIKKYQYEFPAGIGETGESLETIAKRELEEETGLLGEVLYIGPAVTASAGLTDETYFLASLSITGKGSTNFDEHEDITESFLLKLEEKQIKDFLKKAKDEDTLIDAKLYVYLAKIIDKI